MPIPSWTALLTEAATLSLDTDYDRINIDADTVILLDDDGTIELSEPGARVPWTHGSIARYLAERLADALNDYDGDNRWQDVIHGHDYDEAATDEADDGRGCIVVMRSGLRVEYIEHRQTWIVEG